jgi:hypothetical protein
MDRFMTLGTGRNQVLLRISTTLAAIHNVVDLQSGSGAAELAAPVVAFENL